MNYFCLIRKRLIQRALQQPLSEGFWLGHTLEFHSPRTRGAHGGVHGSMRLGVMSNGEGATRSRGVQTCSRYCFARGLVFRSRS